MEGVFVIIYLYQTFKAMLIAPLKRFLTLTSLHLSPFGSSAKPTKLFESLINCPQPALQKHLREMSKLSDENIKTCFDILIARMHAGEIKQPLILNEVYASCIRRFPVYQFHAHLQMIGLKLEELFKLHEQKQDKEEKLKIVEINNLYTAAFETLRKLTPEQVDSEEPFLLSSFATYHSDVLAGLVKDQQVEPTLKKAVDILKRLMNKCVANLENKEKEHDKDFQYTPKQIKEFKKLDKMMENKNTIPKVQRQTIYKQYKSLYYARHCYTQFYGSSVIRLLSIMNRLTHPKSNERKEPPNCDIHPGLFQAIPAMQQALQLYGKLGDERAFEEYYYQIRKLVIELRYEEILARIQPYQIPDVKAEYFQLLSDLKDQILDILANLKFQENDDLAFISAYEVLYKTIVALRLQNLRQSLEYNQSTLRVALEQTFHELIVTVSNRVLKDTIGMHLMNYISEQYGINFLAEFQKQRQMGQLKVQQKKQTPPQEKQLPQLQPRPQVDPPVTRSKPKSKSRRSPIKPSDLQ